MSDKIKEKYCLEQARKIREKQMSINKNTIINQETDRPKHYGSKSGQDVIDVAIDFGIINDAFRFNILKYTLRAGKKDNNSMLQDLMKVKVYAERGIEYLKSLENN